MLRALQKNIKLDTLGEGAFKGSSRLKVQEVSGQIGGVNGVHASCNSGNTNFVCTFFNLFRVTFRITVNHWHHAQSCAQLSIC